MQAVSTPGTGNPGPPPDAAYRSTVFQPVAQGREACGPLGRVPGKSLAGRFTLL